MRAAAIRKLLLPAALAAALGCAGVASAHDPREDKIEASGAKEAPFPARVEVPAPPRVQRAEPPLRPTPQGRCGPGSKPETDIQGRVPRADHDSGRAAKGYTCNAKAIGKFVKANPLPGLPDVAGTVGGFKVERYVDKAGHECAYYDTTLLFPTNIFDLESGVTVLDMSNPRKPELTERLITPAMLSPHESLVISKKRGVLGAVFGNPAFNIGFLDLYDISQDCRHPVFKSSTPSGVFGHESGMAPDGMTFYSGSPGTSTLVGIDISNLTLPQILWVGNVDSHGLSISNSGNRAYVAGTGSGLNILNTKQVQDRVANPQVETRSVLTWDSMSIPQNAIPVTIRGKKYVVEIDEFGTLSEVGAGRLINVQNDRKPRVVSNLRLAVHQPKNFGRISGDPQASMGLQGYAGHYCNVPKRRNPGIAACSMILSGLRVFDIRDPKRPREIAYFNAPIKERITPEPFEASNWAMASPSFAPKRGEIWYSDGFQGFFNVKITNGVWPFPKCRGRTSTVPVTGKRIVGTKGRDVIVGTRRAERIRGRGGRDLICAGRGRDRVTGGSGGDRLFGGGGRDKLRGQKGRDRVNGGRARDDVRR
jgi:hypothetical protein